MGDGVDWLKDRKVQPDGVDWLKRAALVDDPDWLLDADAEKTSSEICRP